MDYLIATALMVCQLCGIISFSHVFLNIVTFVHSTQILDPFAAWSVKNGPPEDFKIQFISSSCKLVNALLPCTFFWLYSVIESLASSL